MTFSKPETFFCLPPCGQALGEGIVSPTTLHRRSLRLKLKRPGQSANASSGIPVPRGAPRIAPRQQVLTKYCPRRVEVAPGHWRTTLSAASHHTSPSLQRNPETVTITPTLGMRKRRSRSTGYTNRVRPESERACLTPAALWPAGSSLAGSPFHRRKGRGHLSVGSRAETVPPSMRTQKHFY